MKNVKKIVVGVVGGVALLTNQVKVSQASFNNTQRYGTTENSIGANKYKDLAMLSIGDTTQYTARPTPTSTSKPTPTYTSKPTPTYTSKPTPTYTSKPTPTYTSKPTAKPTPTYTSKPTPKTNTQTNNIILSIETKISDFFASLFGKR